MTQESEQVLSELLVRVRGFAQTRLAKFSRLEPANCKEVYLFQNDQFCGVRFLLGAFQAEWRTDKQVLHFYRDSNQIDRIELESTDVKKAA